MAKRHKDAGVDALLEIEERGIPKGKKVRFIARGSRNCEACSSMDRRVFDEDHAPVPPLHPNCECKLEPVRD